MIGVKSMSLGISPAPCDKRCRLSVALNDRGLVVEVHTSGHNTPWAHSESPLRGVFACNRHRRSALRLRPLRLRINL
jgi:hypothetical protein